MSILFVLVPLSLALLGIAVWAFIWAVGNGQFDDLDSPAYRILMDNDDHPGSDGRPDAGIRSSGTEDSRR